MSDQLEICRDERCQITEVHRPHLITEREPTRPHHRPKAPKGRTPLWQRPDRSTLTNVIMNATSKSYPVVFRSIQREVRDNYGTVTARTIYRYLSELVQRGHLVSYAVDDLTAYVRPKSRLFADESSVRNYVFDNFEMLADTVKEAI